MEISFAKPQTEGQVGQDGTIGPAGSQNIAIGSQNITAVGRHTPTISEIVLPRVNLVHSVGILKDSFAPGAFVYDQRLVLYTPPQINMKTSTIERAGTPPLIVTFLDFRPVRWFEKVTGGARGLILDTEDQVRSAGGTTNYSEFKLKEKDGIKRFDPGVDCFVALERPECCEDDGTVFIFEVDGKKLALAMYNMKGSAFTVLKKTVKTAQLIGCLREGPETFSWALSSRLEPTPDKTNTYWKPVLIPNRKSSPAFLEFAKSVLQAPKVEVPDDGG